MGGSKGRGVTFMNKTKQYTSAVVGLLIMRSSNKDVTVVAYTHQQVFDIKDVRSAKLSVLQK